MKECFTFLRVGKLKTGLKHLYHTFWLCFKKNKESKSLFLKKLFFLKKKREKREKNDLPSFGYKTNDSHELPKSEFPTLIQIEDKISWHSPIKDLC